MLWGLSGTKLSSTRYVHHGTIKAIVKTGQWNGIVPAFITMSGVRDEIDWEFPGLKTQTNFFWQGTNNNPDISPDVMNMNLKQYHEYTIDWTPDVLVYQIDANTVKEHKAADFPGKVPSTHSRIQLREWGGGMVDWQNPEYVAAGNKFKSYFKSICVTCGGDTPTADQVSYSFAGSAEFWGFRTNQAQASALYDLASYAKLEFPANSGGTGSVIVGSPGAYSVLNSTQSAEVSSPSSTSKKRSSAQQTGIV
ncbi:glycosyl hydrolases family 16-domain-containing protein [Mycena floridula]|nr:glycosyl hydrolases family 16-domain-containing protein [Mycena floridula]